MAAVVASEVVSSTAPLPEVLWLPDVNILVHAALRLEKVFAGQPIGSVPLVDMLRVLDSDEHDAALVDLVTAVVTRSATTAPLIAGTAVTALRRHLGWRQDRAVEVVAGLVRLFPHRVNVTWEDVREEALGSMFDLIDELAPEHLADIDVFGAALDEHNPRVDGDDLGVFVVVRVAEEGFDRPVMFASGDQEACQAAVKAKLATVSRYTRNHGTGRFHAGVGSVRLGRELRQSARQAAGPVPGSEVRSDGSGRVTRMPVPAGDRRASAAGRSAGTVAGRP